MRAILFMLLFISAREGWGQELYPSTEPASNMSSKSIGLRLKGDYYPAYSDQAGAVTPASFRINPELMWGVNKNWMVHADLFASDVYGPFKFEGANLYAKYRFLSSDQVQSHFRMALYGRASLIDNPVVHDEVNLSGNNSGFATGIVATQLIHKIALSLNGGYIRGIPNLGGEGSRYPNLFNYSFSAGFLFLPFHYRNYRQTNVNLYAELLARQNPESRQSYVDIAPAVQLIVNSIARIDLIYTTQLTGNMDRANDRSFSVRLEYNFLNAYK